MFLLLIGFLSAYGLGPTEGTIAIRQEWGQLPADVSHYDVFLAVEDCGLIGREATMYAGGEVYDAVVFDCAGADAFTDGVSWMEASGIAAEVDYHFWQDNEHLIGSSHVAIVFDGG